MFEELKLKKYATSMVGFAYELIPVGIYDNDLTFYIVVPVGDKYTFIKYKEIKRIWYNKIDEIIDEFKAEPISYWLEKNIMITENERNLAVENASDPKVLRFKNPNQK